MSVRSEAERLFRVSSQRRSPRVRPTGQENVRQRGARLEVLWAWASLLVLLVCWDAALRLDRQVSLPRLRIAHAVEMDQDRGVARTEAIEP